MYNKCFKTETICPKDNVVNKSKIKVHIFGLVFIFLKLTAGKGSDFGMWQIVNSVTDLA